MDTTVRSRPNHYAVLGLTPAATEEEIGQAFARSMSLFRARPLADIAQATAAYETLRNPAKRQAYDDALGLKARPEPKAEAHQWGFAVTQQRWAPFVGSGAMNLVAHAAAEEPHVEAGPGPEASADPKAASIAASLREVAKPIVRDSSPPTPPAEPVQRLPKVELGLDLQAEQIRVVRHPLADRWSEAEDGPTEWRRTALLIGGLVLGVGLIGGVAGIAAGGDVQNSVTVAVPAAKPVAEATPPSAPLAASLIDARREQPARAEAAPLPTERSRSIGRTAMVENAPLEAAVQSSPPESEGDGFATDPLAPKPAVAEPVAASLPLSNAVIARTIERIGYSCGEVASTTQVEGRGAFKITCSSGQTYQASPVRGRYHFRRWRGQ